MEDTTIHCGSIRVTRGGRDIVWEHHPATFCYIMMDWFIQQPPMKMPFDVLSRLQADCAAIIAMIPANNGYDTAIHVLSRMNREMKRRFTNNMRTILNAERMHY